MTKYTYYLVAFWSRTRVFLQANLLKNSYNKLIFLALAYYCNSFLPHSKLICCGFKDILGVKLYFIASIIFSFEHHTFILLLYVLQATAGERACYQSMTTYFGQLVLLGTRSVQVLTVRTWQEVCFA